MIFVWKFLVRPMGGALDIYELLPAFVVGLAAIVDCEPPDPGPGHGHRKALLTK